MRISLEIPQFLTLQHLIGGFCCSLSIYVMHFKISFCVFLYPKFLSYDKLVSAPLCCMQNCFMFFCKSVNWVFFLPLFVGIVNRHPDQKLQLGNEVLDDADGSAHVPRTLSSDYGTNIERWQREAEERVNIS